MPPENLESGVQRTGDPQASILAAAVGFYFAFRIFIVLLSVRIFGTEPQTGTAINLAIDGVLLLTVSLGCFGPVHCPFAHMARPVSVKCALLFLGFSCLSMLWSDTPSLPVSIAYWCGMAADFAAVALLLRAMPVTTVAASLMKGYICGACLGAAIAWLLPAQSDLRLGDEDLLGPNSIGYVCALAFLFAQFLLRNRQRGWGIPAFLLAITVLRCLSKTTIVALIACEAFLLITDRSITRRTKMLLTVGAAMVIAAFSALLASYYDIYTNAGNQSESFSGRLGIWAYFLTEGVNQPWLGHGFDGVWKVVPPFGPDMFQAPHAHNELLQQFYAYGVIGICLFIGIYGSLFKQIRRLPPSPARTFFFTILLFVLVRGLADTERFDLSLPLWAVLMVSALIEAARVRVESTTVVSQLERLQIGQSPLTGVDNRGELAH